MSSYIYQLISPWDRLVVKETEQVEAGGVVTNPNGTYFLLGEKKGDPKKEITHWFNGRKINVEQFNNLSSLHPWPNEQTKTVKIIKKMEPFKEATGREAQWMKYNAYSQDTYFILNPQKAVTRLGGAALLLAGATHYPTQAAFTILVLSTLGLMLPKK